MTEVVASLNRFLPESVLTVALLLVVLVDASRAAWRNGVIRAITLLALLGALVLCRPLSAVGAGPLWSGMLILDSMGVFFKVLLLLASLIVVGAFSFRSSREL